MRNEIIFFPHNCHANLFPVLIKFFTHKSHIFSVGKPDNYKLLICIFMVSRFMVRQDSAYKTEATRTIEVVVWEAFSVHQSPQDTCHGLIPLGYLK